MSVCLSVRLSVSRLTRTGSNRFGWNFQKWISTIQGPGIWRNFSDRSNISGVRVKKARNPEPVPIPMCYGLSRFHEGKVLCYSIGYSRPCTQATMDGLYGCRSSTITYPTTRHRHPTTWRPTNFIRQKFFYFLFFNSVFRFHVYISDNPSPSVTNVKCRPPNFF